MTTRIALLLMLAGTGCLTVDHTVKRSDGSGEPTRVIKFEVGGVASMGTSAGDVADAYRTVKGADTDEMVCKADPNSARCVVGGIQDPQAAAYILRRGYSRPFGGSARVYPLAGAPSRLVAADGSSDAYPDMVALAPPSPPPPLEPMMSGGSADTESRDTLPAAREAVAPVVARSGSVRSAVRCTESRRFLRGALDAFEAAFKLARDASAETVAETRGRISDHLRRAERVLGDGLDTCKHDVQALREIAALRAGIPGLRETYGLPKEG